MIRSVVDGFSEASDYPGESGPLIVRETKGVFPRVQISVYPLGKVDPRRRCFDNHPAAIAWIRQAPNEAGALKAIERERHSAGGATEHLTNSSRGTAVIRRSPNNTKHEVVGDRNTRRTNGLVQHTIDRHVETDDVTKKPVGARELLSH